MKCLGGRDLSPEDEEAIRTAAQLLLSFVGTKKDPICAEGWHWAKSMSTETNRRRCVKCGYEWIFPEEKPSGDTVEMP